MHDQQNKGNNPYYSQKELVEQSPSPLYNQGPYPPIDGNNYPPVRQNNNIPNISNGIQGHNQYISSHPQQNQQNQQNQAYVPQNYPPQTFQPQQPQQIYIINQQPSSMLAHCPFCGTSTQTFVQRVNGCFVWVMFLLFFFFFCILCCIPFLVDSWKDQQFRCRKCGQIKNVVGGGC